MANLAEVPDRHAELPAELERKRASRLASMHMLMRVEVARVPPGHAPEALELPVHLRLRHLTLVDGLPLVVSKNPFAEIEVQSETKPRMATR